MFGLTAATSIYLYRGVCDMRKSFDGLCGIIRSDLNADPLSGSLFVFVNRRRSMVKLLYWDQDGLALWYKRLERGVSSCPISGLKMVASSGAIYLCSWKESCRRKWKKDTKNINKIAYKYLT